MSALSYLLAFFAFIAVYSFSALCGLCILSFRNRKYVSILELMLAPMAGLAALGLQLWCYGLLSIPWNRWSLVLPWLLASLLLRQRLKHSLQAIKKDAHSQTYKWKQLLGWPIFLIGICFVAICIYTIHTIGQANTSADYLAFWGYKAKEFYGQQAVYVNESIRSSVRVANYFHVDYPPLYPLMADALYVLKGSVSELLMRSIPLMLWLTGCLTIFACIAKRSGAKTGLVFSSLLVLGPPYVHVLLTGKYLAFADLPISTFMLCAGLYAIKVFNQSDKQAPLIAVGFAAAAALIKNEGMPFLLLIVGFCGLTLFKRYAHTLKPKHISRSPLLVYAVWVAACLIPLGLWELYKHRHGIGSEFALNGEQIGPSGLARLRFIAHILRNFVFESQVYAIQLCIIVFGAIMSLFQRNKELALVSAIVILQIGAYIVSYFLSPHELNWHISTSIDRLLTQVLPLTVLALALATPTIERRTKNTTAI